MSKDFDYTETPKTLMTEKLIMNELLNAGDFCILLQTVQDEFKKTFCCSNKESLEEKEIE